MEYDLTRGLRDLSRTPPVTPLPAEPVVRRVRRGRAIRTTAVGLASAAVVIGAAAVVYAAPWDPAPVPPATPAPTTPTLSPTPEPSPEPTEDPTPEDPPIVALTTAGDLVLLDPETGETLEVIASDEALRGPISLTADRSDAYLVREGPPYEVVRVSLTDGSIATIADGLSPSLSPDERTLAYVAPYNINHPDDSEWRSLALLDLATGEVQYVPDNSCGGCARRIDQPAWSPDGSRVYVALGFFDGPAPDMDLIVIDPSAPPVDIQAAAPFAFADTNPRDPVFPVFMPDGDLAMAGVADFGTGDAGDGATSLYGYIEVVDVSTGATVQFEQHSALHMADWSGDPINWTLDTAAPPTGRGLAIVAAEHTSPGAEPTYWLFLQNDPGLQPLAQGIVAVAW